MDNVSYLARSAFPVVWILVPAIGAFVRARRVTSPRERLEIWQRWWAIGAFGIGSLWMTVAFLVFPDVMATAIGFDRTPFLFEIAFANLGLAVMGFRAASASPRERITIGLGGGMFLWGAVVGHVYQWFANGDHAPGNTGGVLVNDILIPAVMIILAVRSQRLAATPRPAVELAA
jgi:apolipoprotein N-acyltransferase